MRSRGLQARRNGGGLRTRRRWLVRVWLSHSTVSVLGRNILVFPGHVSQPLLAHPRLGVYTRPHHANASARYDRGPESARLLVADPWHTSWRSDALVTGFLCQPGTFAKLGLPLHRMSSPAISKHPLRRPRGIWAMLSGMITSPRFRSPNGGLLALAAVLLCNGCDRHVRVTMHMDWECLPPEPSTQYPNAQPVRFRYVENPGYFDVTSGRGLCEQLRSSSHKTAQVTYEVWGTSHGLHGYRIESVNGLPLQDFGGPARSGHDGMGTGGPHPLATALK